MAIREVAIVGGGPSGAMCGERLARAGFEVTIYDEHLAWEKPCGGGLTHRAITAYPFLLDAPRPKKLIHNLELISSRGHRAWLKLEHPIVIYSRAALNGLLLERAAAAGCRVLQSHVTSVDTTRPRISLIAGEQIREADFLVIAAGARNALLPAAQPLGPGDLEITLGYFVPAQADAIQIKFLPRFEGYIWSFPRADHLSVGICGSMARHNSRELRQALAQFLTEQRLSTEGAQFYSHVLPSPQIDTLRRRRVAGTNWALAGDAAAFVDPVTGEGIYYALRSGQLLAEALAAGSPEQYAARIRSDFSGDLEFGTHVAPRLYRGRFLGAAASTRMVQFIGRSATFRALMRDLFSGAQNYAGLKRRLWAQLGMTLSEVLASLMQPRSSLAHTATDA